MLVGLGLWALSLIWWFFYYSQYDGALQQLGTKAPCFAVTINDCLDMQQRLSGSAMPVYHPVLLWAGLIAVILGIMQRRTRRV